MTSFLNSIGKRKKSPEQLVISSKQALQTIIDTSAGKEDEKAAAMDNLNKFLVEIKNILYGNIDNLELDEEKVLEASKYIQSEGLILMLINNIDVVSFEARKDIALIFNNLIRKNVNNFAQYLADNIEIMQVLLLGYLSSDSALSCGSMLRESIRHENIARYILLSDSVWSFFDTYVHLPNFEVASDAFNTLRDLLTTPKHKHVAEEFMEAHCDKLLEKYDVLLQSDNYVTRRRSLKLLSELLLDRNNYTVMMKYISSKHHLKTVMNLLRHKSPQIQFETFHVFKIFVANPSKTPEIESILCKNRTKLIAYLEVFHTENEDPQFVDEKRLLIDTLQQLIEPAHETRSHSNSLVSASERLSERGSERSSGRSLSREGSSHLGTPSESVVTPENASAATTFATSSDPSHATTEVDAAAAQLQHKVVISDATTGTASTTDSTLVSSLSQGSL